MSCEPSVLWPEVESSVVEFDFSMNLLRKIDSVEERVISIIFSRKPFIIEFFCFLPCELDDLSLNGSRDLKINRSSVCLFGLVPFFSSAD